MIFKREALSTPQNLEEASKAIERIQQLDHEIEQLRLELAKKHNEQNGEIWQKSLPLIHERDELVQAVERFASANRAQLTVKKKSVEMPCGKFGWRQGSVCVEITDEEALIAELERRGLDRYINTRKVLDRSLLITDKKRLERLGIPGLSYRRGERFYIKINKPKQPRQDALVPHEVALSPS